MIEDLGSARPRGQRISPRDLDPAGEQLGILLVSHSPTMFGGAERSLVALASDLGRRPGVDVTVVVPANGPLRDALAAAGVRTVVVPFGWSVEAGDPKLEISIRAMPAMMRLVSEVAPDVIITNTTLIPWFGYVAHLRGIPHAWYLREDVTASINFAYHPDVERTLACIRAWSDHVIVASEFMQRRYAELLARRDIQVVYPSISRDGLEDFGPRVPHEGGLRLIVAGSIAPHKNQLEALEGLRLLHDSHPDVRLTIIGYVASPQYQTELETFVRSHALSGRVRFLPHHDDLYAILREHDVCIVPSVAEPFGRITIEAMALRLAVVAADAGGSTEIVGRDSQAGLLYPSGRPELLATHLRTLADDTELRQRMGERAHDRVVERFLEPDHVAGLVASLGTLAKRPKPRSVDWISVEALERVARLSDALDEQGDSRMARITELETHAGALQVLSDARAARVTELETHARALEEQGDVRAARIQELETHARALEEQSDVQTARIQELETHARALQELSDVRTARIQELETHARALQELSKTRAERVTELETHARALQEQSAMRAARITELETHARALEEQADARATRIQDLEAHVSALEEQRDAIARERERVVGLNEDLRASTSWRLTSPFRAAGRKVRGIRDHRSR